MERIDYQRQVSKLLVRLESNVRWRAREIVQTILRHELEQRLIVGRPTRAQLAPTALSRRARETKKTSAAPAAKRKKQNAVSEHPRTLYEAIERAQRDVITQALAASEQRVSAAARQLGLARSHLYKLMHKLGLTAARDRAAGVATAPRRHRVTNRPR